MDILILDKLIEQLKTEEPLKDLGADILTEDNIEPWVKDHLKPISRWGQLK